VTVKEIGFEEAIERWLVDHGGYTSSSPQHFDRVLGLDTAELFAFIGATQVNDWNRLLERHGNDADAAQRSFVRRLAADLDSRGTVDVLRHGVDDLGVLIQLSFPRPAFGFTPEL
jgi:type I restriction enzyme R subunit